MGKKDGQRPEAQIQRTNQKRDCDTAAIGNQKLRYAGSSPQCVMPFRVNRPDRVGRDRTRYVLGGILTQLIDEAEDQLGDAQECIARQQRRIAKLQQRLDNLKQLQELQEDNTN